MGRDRVALSAVSFKALLVLHAVSSAEQPARVFRSAGTRADCVDAGFGGAARTLVVVTWVWVSTGSDPLHMVHLHRARRVKTRISKGVAIAMLMLAGCSNGNGAGDSSTSSAPQRTAAADTATSAQARTTSTAPSTTSTAGTTASTAVAGYDLSTPSSCVMRNAVELGSVGDDVRCLQTRLDEVTVTGEQIIVDGDFGPATDRAVRAFQDAHGLVVDGVAGAQTADRLGIWSPDSPGTPTSAAAG